jgi:hypothetical protein
MNRDIPVVSQVEIRAICPPGIKDTMDRERFDKIMAVAVNPGAYEDEAVAALRKARELVKQNPSLAHPPPAPIAPIVPKPPPDHSVEYRVTHISPFWMNIFIGSLSEQAYGLGLRSKFSFDFGVIPTAVDVRCDGPIAGCGAFKAHLDWLIEYINSQPPKSH